MTQINLSLADPDTHHKIHEFISLIIFPLLYFLKLKKHLLAPLEKKIFRTI